MFKKLFSYFFSYITPKKLYLLPLTIFLKLFKVIRCIRLFNARYNNETIILLIDTYKLKQKTQKSSLIFSVTHKYCKQY